jgi:ketosteroid isomerase-like protein
VTKAIDTVRNFYSALSSGDIERAKSLMADDIEWINVQVWPKPDDGDDLAVLSAFIAQTLADQYGRGWAFKMNGRGPDEVAQFVLETFVDAGASLVPSPMEFKADDEKVVWIGNLTQVDQTTGKRKDSSFAHVWTVKGGSISRLRQYDYELSAPEGRPQ